IWGLVCQAVPASIRPQPQDRGGWPADDARWWGVGNGEIEGMRLDSIAGLLGADPARSRSSGCPGHVGSSIPSGESAACERRRPVLQVRPLKNLVSAGPVTSAASPQALSALRIQTRRTKPRWARRLL